MMSSFPVDGFTRNTKKSLLGSGPPVNLFFSLGLAVPVMHLGGLRRRRGLTTWKPSLSVFGCHPLIP